MSTLPQTRQLRVAHLADSPPARGVRHMAQYPPHALTERLSIGTAEGIFVIDINEIVRCEANGNYCFVHYSNDQKILCSKTLKAVIQYLPGHAFVRVHQSHMVSLSMIRLVSKDEVILRNGDVVPVSRQQRSVLTSRITAFTQKV